MPSREHDNDDKHSDRINFFNRMWFTLGSVDWHVKMKVISKLVNESKVDHVVLVYSKDKLYNVVPLQVMLQTGSFSVRLIQDDQAEKLISNLPSGRVSIVLLSNMTRSFKFARSISKLSADIKSTLELIITTQSNAATRLEIFSKFQMNAIHELVRDINTTFIYPKHRRPVDPLQSAFAKKLCSHYRSLSPKRKEPPCNQFLQDALEIPQEAYQTFDGILHGVLSLVRIIYGYLPNSIINKSVEKPFSLEDCMSLNHYNKDKSDLALKIYQSIHETQTDGLQGMISIGNTNENLHHCVKVVKIQKNSNERTSFEYNHSHNSTKPIIKEVQKSEDTLEGVSFKIVTIEEPPFVFSAKNETTGEIYYDGFLIEMFDFLRQYMGFEYEIYEVEDLHYGNKQPDGSWNGMIGDLISGKANISLSAMTVTPAREKVVDFTPRFMKYSISILLKSPEATSNVWSFVKPFDNHVWVSIFLTIFISTGILGIFVKTFNFLQTPSCHDKIETIPPDTSALKLIVTVLWFIVSTTMQQGGEHSMPKTYSVKVFIAIWWFFALILISTYTANLAAFLTMSRLDTPIRSFNDLANQDEIAYGTVADSSVIDFIKERAEQSSSSNDMFHKMLIMLNRQGNVVEKLKDGLDRVKNSSKEAPYAFLWDERVVHYHKQHDKLALVGV